MAGTIAERLATGQPIEGHEELLLTETLDPTEAKHFEREHRVAYPGNLVPLLVPN
jgi:hypothetical protein